MLATSAVVKGYRVSDHYPGVYLSYTELQILAGLMRNKELTLIACELGLATRTVEYYCCSMMKLMDCKALVDLVDSIRDSDLGEYIQ